MSRGIGFLFIIFLLLLWELACRMVWLDPIYFPAPSSIFFTLGELVLTKEFGEQIGTTLKRAGLGYLWAVLIAVPVGLLMGKFRWVGLLLEPLVDILRPMPSAAIIPIAILLLGIDNEMKISVVFFGSLWAIVVSTIDGIKAIDPLLIDTGRLLHLNWFQTMTKIVLPSALPSIATGMKISLAIALILAITSEMVAGSDGLGYFIIDTQRGFAYRQMFAGIIMLGIIGYVVSQTFNFLEKRVLFWHYIPRAKSGRKFQALTGWFRRAKTYAIGTARD